MIATLPASLFLAIPLAIAAGLVSFLSPCVLPLLPGYLAFLTGATGRIEGKSGAGRAFIGSIAFILGFSLVFVSIGALFGEFGSALHNHEEFLERIFGVVTIALGLFFAGWWPSSWLQRDRRIHHLPRATVLGGRAVIKAAEQMKKDLDDGKTMHDLIGKKYFGEVVIDYTTALDAKTNKPVTHMTFGFATQVCVLDDNGKLKKFVAAHDVGRVINRKLLEGQLEGSIHMGLGYALTEELKLKDGVPESFKLRSLGLLRAKDMPETEILLIEEHESEGPFGAKGVGEIGLVPTAGAVAGALFKFDGIRRYKLPMKDSPAAKAIMGKAG